MASLHLGNTTLQGKTNKTPQTPRRSPKFTREALKQGQPRDTRGCSQRWPEPAAQHEASSGRMENACDETSSCGFKRFLHQNTTFLFIPFLKFPGRTPLGCPSSAPLWRVPGGQIPSHVQPCSVHHNVKQVSPLFVERTQSHETSFSKQSSGMGS